MKTSPIRIEMSLVSYAELEESHMTYETRDTLSSSAHEDSVFNETNVVADYIKEFCEDKCMSRRDMDILSMAVNGYTHQEIGEFYGISRNTVGKVLNNFKDKFAYWLLKNHTGQWIVQQWYF